MKFLFSFFFFVLSSITCLFGQDQLVDTAKTKVFIEYNLLDLPFQVYAGKTLNSTIANPDASVNFFGGMQYKSMEQSLQITTGIGTAGAWGIKQIPVFKKKPTLQKIVHATLSFALPLIPVYGGGWLHEEHHRAVMVTNYTNSYNPLDPFSKKDVASGGGPVAAVSYVLDTNLVQMKDKNLPSFIRLHTAGAEGEISLIENFQKQNFFNNQKLYLSAYYLMNSLSVYGYINQCADKLGSTTLTENEMKKEGNRQELRDFTGLDFTAWAYDLWRPSESYSGRGLNPYGNGYDRYIKGTDLTDEQLDWLKKQATLSLLNFVSPMNFFISSIKLKKLSDGSYLRGNFSFRYYPTSFGNQIGLDLMVKYKNLNLFVSPHLNQNFKNSFPGLDVAVVDYPLNVRNMKFLASVFSTVDLQPQSDGFLLSKSAFVASLKTTVKWLINKRFYTFASVSGKTDGWIKGNSFMKSNIGASIGFGFMLQNN
jgi:hypothetical protein